MARGGRSGRRARGLLATAVLAGAVAVAGPSWSTAAVAEPASTWATVTTGEQHSCGVTTDGAGYCWGEDFDGLLGNGPDLTGNQPSPSPIDTPTGATWATISAGSRHSCGVTTEGAGYCWGEDTGGRLGDGPDLTGVRVSPSPVDTPTGVAWDTISVGYHHACGVTTQGAGYCWGEDPFGFGWLGTGPGTTGNQVSPAPIDTPTGVTWATIAAGEFHSCGVTTEGAGYCWGVDVEGLLGNGSDGAGVQVSPAPIDTPAGVAWATIAAGIEHSCGVTTQGAGYCWGSDGSGQLGNGPDLTGPQVSPSPVATPTGAAWATISVGFLHSCGVTTDGAGHCWGDDGSGQLGNGPDLTGVQVSPSPVVTPTGVTWATIAAGVWHSCGVTTDGAGHCWGDDAGGRLGNGPDLTGVQVSPSPLFRAPQSITFEPLPDVVVGSAPFDLVASASSGLPVQFTASGTCTVTGATVTVTGVGACTITASQPGDAVQAAAEPVARTFAVTQGSQSITFEPLADVTFGTPPFDLVASASSGLPVSFTASGTCSVTGATVTVTGAGACTITASQPGDDDWAPAEPVDRTFAVTQGSQSITFEPLADVTFGTPPFDLVASASSGLPVSFTASGTCTVSGVTVTVTGAGACTITASQPGDDDWAPAQPVARTFAVAGAVATVTISDTERVYDGAPKPVVVVTDPAGLAVAVTYDGSTVAPTDAGSYAVAVTVTDPDHVTDPSPVPATLVIARAGQTIDLVAPTGVAYGDDPFAVVATSSSGLPVTVTAAGACTLDGTTVTATGAGECVLSAVQAGDANHDPAPAATATVAIAPAASTTTLGGPDAPTPVGTEATFTATVAGATGTGVPAGTVTFATDTGATATVALDAAGTATWATSGLGPGDHVVTAAYDGTGDHAGSTAAPLTHAVRTAALSLAGLPDQVAVGDEVTVTATGFVPGEAVELVLRSDPVTVATPTADPFGTATATFAVPDLPPGPHTLTATGATSGLTVTAATTITADPTDPSDPAPSDPAPSGPGRPGPDTRSAPLPRTGTDPLPLAAVAAALLAAGTVLHTRTRQP